MVHLEEIRHLPIRMQAAWAAVCIERLRPLLPPTYLERMPSDSCVHAAWEFALGRQVNRVQLQQFADHIEAISTVFGQGDLAPGNPGGWMEEERHHLAYHDSAFCLFE